MLFFFTDPAPPEIYTLSLHDALPISATPRPPPRSAGRRGSHGVPMPGTTAPFPPTCGSHDRSEEHTSELQSRLHLVCRLLLEKKKKKKKTKPLQNNTSLHKHSVPSYP